MSTQSDVRLTKRELQQLQAELPPLDCSDAGLAANEVFLATDRVQKYLDYYQINFSNNFPNMRHQFGRFSAAGFELACHIWRPRSDTLGHADSFKGMVWFQHGYTDHVGLCRHAIEWLLLQGYGVVCFDLPGHGLSSGFPASIQSFDQYRDVLLASVKLAEGGLPKPWHAVGQSTGCAVLLNLMASYPQTQYFQRVVLLAPLIRSRAWASLRWPFYLLRLFMSRITRSFNDSSHDQRFLDFLQYHDPLQTRYMPVEWLSAMDNWASDFGDFSVQNSELTIVQGRDDQTVDYRYNIAAIERKFYNTHIYYIDDARHQLINESLNYRQQVWAYMAYGLAQA